ncbi:hypothetical protein ACN28E_52250 [Archangium lansingense]|uniref:hypothetical protein n=1 Tax=Archangium lansingense TaxID=2995310 RepID=UPI003B7C186E
MKVQTILQHPQEVIGKRWREDQSPEQARILGLARDALRFILATGQHYPFEDFRKGLQPAPPVKYREDFLALTERLGKTVEFFTNLLDEPDSAGEEELIQVILDTLRFISATGQYEAFSQYLEHLEAGAPPYIVAAFNTKQEAQSWLDQHPAPPCFASILIGNDYHAVMYDRETNFRRLPKANSSISCYLVDLEEEGPPVATASFATHEEAEAWLRAQPNPARRAWVTIGSELYLAAYHPKFNHRALYPLSMADGYRDDA